MNWRILVTTKRFKLKLLWISQTFSVPVVNLLTFLLDESQLGESRPEYHNTSMKKTNIRPKNNKNLSQMRSGGSSSCLRVVSSRSWTWPRLRRPSQSLTRSLSFSPLKVTWRRHHISRLYNQCLYQCTWCRARGAACPVQTSSTPVLTHSPPAFSPETCTSRQQQ